MPFDPKPRKRVRVYSSGVNVRPTRRSHFETRTRLDSTRLGARRHAQQGLALPPVRPGPSLPPRRKKQKKEKADVGSCRGMILSYKHEVVYDMQSWNSPCFVDLRVEFLFRFLLFLGGYKRCCGKIGSGGSGRHEQILLQDVGEWLMNSSPRGCEVAYQNPGQQVAQNFCLFTERWIFPRLPDITVGISHNPNLDPSARPSSGQLLISSTESSSFWAGRERISAKGKEGGGCMVDMSSVFCQTLFENPVS